MREILGKAKTIRELLKGVKYSIDYYQREYRWEEKQIHELVDDLCNKFLEEYRPDHSREQVAAYPHYFLGSIIISKRESVNFIVDGQQRLTSVTLLLCFLRRLQTGRPDAVNVDELIVSEKFGRKAFNLDVEERNPCMAALYDGGRAYDTTDQPESVQNIVARAKDIDAHFDDAVRGSPLPYFVDWLLENVHLVEITAYSDDDAYTIFETMNDRGLSLNPTDMLKGYLLSNVTDIPKRTAANRLWRDRMRELIEAGKEAEADTFKTWLRSQYAKTIRERKKGAKAEDFERIGTEFHRWVRENAAPVGLKSSDDFYEFIQQDFNFYSRQYLRLLQAAHEGVAGLEHVHYVAQHGFTLQFMLLLAPLRPDDSEDVAVRKQRLVGRFLDILLARRLWNFRVISYSTVQYAMFLVMREIRGLDLAPLAAKLRDILDQEKDTFASNDRLRVHVQNRYHIHRLLARLTDYVEVQSGMPSRYREYVSDSGRNRYEVEHVWADKPERHVAEFPQPEAFAEFRNRIGGLLLLPKSFNASYGALSYDEKLPHYNAQNLLARSLHPHCYDRNPGFVRFVQTSGLPFHPHEQFDRADFEARSTLYRRLAERVWNPDDLQIEVNQRTIT